MIDFDSARKFINGGRGVGTTLFTVTFDVYCEKTLTVFFGRSTSSKSWFSKGVYVWEVGKRGAFRF